VVPPLPSGCARSRTKWRGTPEHHPRQHSMVKTSVLSQRILTCARFQDGFGLPKIWSIMASLGQEGDSKMLGGSIRGLGRSREMMYAILHYSAGQPTGRMNPEWVKIACDYDPLPYLDDAESFHMTSSPNKSSQPNAMRLGSKRYGGPKSSPLYDISKSKECKMPSNWRASDSKKATSQKTSDRVSNPVPDQWGHNNIHDRDSHTTNYLLARAFLYWSYVVKIQARLITLEMTCNT
jgi:hypothetical protein